MKGEKKWRGTNGTRAFQRTQTVPEHSEGAPLEAGEARVPFKDGKQVKNKILFKNLQDFVKK